MYYPGIRGDQAVFLESVGREPRQCGDRADRGSRPRLDLIIVPAVAFDRRGNRLGRGKGFYDRLLQKAKCPKIGIAYHFQLLDEIPAEPHDIPMDKIITEQGILSINNITSIFLRYGISHS